MLNVYLFVYGHCDFLPQRLNQSHQHHNQKNQNESYGHSVQEGDLRQAKLHKPVNHRACNDADCARKARGFFGKQAEQEDRQNARRKKALKLLYVCEDVSEGWAVQKRRYDAARNRKGGDAQSARKHLSLVGGVFFHKTLEYVYRKYCRSRVKHRGERAYYRAEQRRKNKARIA